jgi:methyltransferase-like protein/protein-L-isoaspartate O-methyltransferase
MTPNSYDLVPYTSYAFSQTHPEVLFTIARLFGREPPSPRRARVLELGCAGGGNLIPMAFNAPESELVGVDLSSRQVAAARERIERLGLRNIDVRAMSIADVDRSLGTFDYILCHGVYSWVPPDVRRSILDICGSQLSPTGVAYISYNTLPGWNMVRTIRDLMLFHAQHLGSPEERIEQARAILPFVVEALEAEASPYADYLRNELQELAQRSDDYLFHEYLELFNEPVYFADFIAAARERGLDYLAETDLASMFAGNMPDGTASRLFEVEDIVATEQYMDFIRNRRFRCTLLVHADGATRRTLTTTDVERFLLTTDYRPLGAWSADDSPLDFGTTEPLLTVTDAVSKAALCILAERGAHPIDYAALVEAVAARCGIDDADAVREQLNEGLNLLRLAFAGIVQLHSAPPPCVAVVEERPVVTALARDQLACGDPVTTQRHQVITLDPFESALAALLDGSRTVPELHEAMLAEFRAGRFVFEQDDADLDASVRQLCDLALRRLAAAALLV